MEKIENEIIPSINSIN